MRIRLLSGIGAAATAAALASAPLSAQNTPNMQPAARAQAQRACPDMRDFAAFHKCAIEKMKTFKPPVGKDGRPDFNGLWSTTRSAQDIEEIQKGQYGDFPASKSLIVDPPNGKIPYQPWAQELRISNEKKYLSPTAVCLPVGVQRWVYSPVATTGHRIIQQPNQITFSMERLHTYRIIPLNSKLRKLDPSIKMWQGDSRGRWEGNTLVIETTNLNDYVWFDHIGTFISDEATMVERFTYVDANTVHYEETITDPRVFTQPWKIAKALTRIPDPKGIDLMDLEDTSVEFCEPGLVHMIGAGQVPYRGLKSIAPGK